MWIVTKGVLFAYILLKIINSHLAIFSRTGRVVFCVPEDGVSKLGANILHNLSWKTKYQSSVLYFVSRYMNVQKYWSIFVQSVKWMLCAVVTKPVLQGKPWVVRHMCKSEQDLSPLQFSFWEHRLSYQTPQSIVILKLVCSISSLQHLVLEFGGFNCLNLEIIFQETIK